MIRFWGLCLTPRRGRGVGDKRQESRVSLIPLGLQLGTRSLYFGLTNQLVGFSLKILSVDLHEVVCVRSKVLFPKVTLREDSL